MLHKGDVWHAGGDRSRIWSKMKTICEAAMMKLSCQLKAGTHNNGYTLTASTKCVWLLKGEWDKQLLTSTSRQPWTDFEILGPWTQACERPPTLSYTGAKLIVVLMHLSVLVVFAFLLFCVSVVVFASLCGHFASEFLVLMLADIHAMMIDRQLMQTWHYLR